MALNPNALQAAKIALESAERLLVIPHANVDPDGLSSALACYTFFRDLGKQCTVICPDTPPETLAFLPAFKELSTNMVESRNFVITLDCSGGVEMDKLRYTVEDQKVNIIVTPKKGILRKENVEVIEGEHEYDLIVVVDSAELSLLGSFYTDHVDLFSEVPVLNIDHHISNTMFGQVQLVDPTAASATQVLYSWLSTEAKWKKFITPDMATLLLTGLITDTRSFQNPNTTPRSLEVAADLVDLGARQQEIIRHIYKTKPLSTLKIWGRALHHIEIDPESHIVWSTVSKEDLKEMSATSKETSGILDELISTIPDADVYVLFTELENGEGLKASIRSTPVIDVSALAARLYGGGGHARAAGFSVKKFSNFQLQVMECVSKMKEDIARQRHDSGDMRNGTMPEAHAGSASPKYGKEIPSLRSPIAQKHGIDIVDTLHRNGRLPRTLETETDDAENDRDGAKGKEKKNGK